MTTLRCLNLSFSSSTALNLWKPFLVSTSSTVYQKRFGTGKHYDPKWRKYRAAKFLKIDLPDFSKARRESKLPPDELREKLKKEKMMPPRTFQEREIVIACTNTLFEPYAPPEGDGLASLISQKGATQRVTNIGKKTKSFNEVRKIKKFEEDFDTSSFADQAYDTYIEAHELLQNYKENEDRLHELVTEKAFPEMVWKLDRKTVRWQFLQSLEPPRTVHVRTTQMMSKENLYAQVTVRFLTQQTLAIYDQFGRLMFGSESLAKDCLDYIVFEKHLADDYGKWRIHGKVVPDWKPKDTSIVRTLKMPHFEPIPEEEETNKEETAVATNQSDESGPQVATA